MVFQIFSLLLFVNLSTETEIVSAKYEVLFGIKLQNPYKTIWLNRNTTLKCALYCLSEHDSCRSANYNGVTKKCELNNQSPLEEAAIIQENSDWKLIYANNETWEMVFRGSAGISIDLYPSFKGTISLSSPEVGCRLTHTLTCSTHYRNNIIDDWQTHNILQVKFAMYKNNYTVVDLIFNNLNTNSNEDWFSKDRLVSSSYSDLTANQQFNFFNISGHGPATRRFYINKSFPGCPNDEGWVAVFDYPNAGVCNYEIGLQYPYFAYIPNNAVGNWNTLQSADVLAIFIRRV